MKYIEKLCGLQFVDSNNNNFVALTSESFPLSYEPTAQLTCFNFIIDKIYRFTIEVIDENDDHLLKTDETISIQHDSVTPDKIIGGYVSSIFLIKLPIINFSASERTYKIIFSIFDNDKKVDSIIGYLVTRSES